MTDATSVTGAHKVADAPFDDRELSDIILTTSDNVDFYLARVILSFSSPFFRTMFSLQQPKRENNGELECITVSEDSKVLDALLRYCYPVDHPVLQEVGILGGVLEAALKYQVDKATTVLKGRFRKVIDRFPLHAYAIACRLQCEEEARLAANRWANFVSWDDILEDFLKTSAGRSLTPESSSLTAGQYYRLLRCMEGTFSYANQSIVDGHRYDVRPHTPPHTPPPRLPLSSSYGLSKDAILRSPEGHEYPIHTAILHLSGLGGLLEPLETASSSDTMAVIDVDIPSATLHDIVPLCYPLSRHKISSFARIDAAARAIQKYECAALFEVLKHQLRDLPSTIGNQLQAYFFARRQGWVEEALDYARRIVRQPPSDLASCYVEVMEDVPAQYYFDLLSFCHRYKAAASEMVAATIAYQKDDIKFLNIWELYPLLDGGDASVRKTVLRMTVDLAARAAVTRPNNVRECIQCTKSWITDTLPQRPNCSCPLRHGVSKLQIYDWAIEQVAKLEEELSRVSLLP